MSLTRAGVMAASLGLSASGSKTMCSFALQTPSEKRAHSALSSLKRRPVESIRCTASPILRRRPRPACATRWANNAPNTSLGRVALASDKVERDTARAEMVEPVRMTGEPGFDLAQALRARQLPVQKRDELIPRRQPAHSRVGPVRVHQPIERLPRQMLQDRVEYAILMPHGVDPLPCPETLPDVRKTEESTPCALSTKTQPDSRV